MLLGRFDLNGEPFVSAVLRLPRLGVQGPVSFLLDTGASGTVLMPPDTARLNIQFAQLGNQVTNQGVGGPGQAYSEPAFITMGDDTYEYTFQINLSIAQRTTYNITYPSLLGRDVANRWRYLYDPQKGEIRIKPVSWYRRVP